MNDPRGSIWRKWDLHVHSPASDGFRGTYEELVESLEKSEAEVIGINDYYTIAGYEIIKSIAPSLSKTILPVVEFRMHNIVASRKPKGGIVGTRFNFHLIINNEASVVEKVKTWLSSLDCYNSDGQIVQLGTLNPSNYDKIGVDYMKTNESLKKYGLENSVLILLPYDEYGGIDDVDPTDSFFKLGMIKKANIIGSSSQKQIDFFLWKNEKYTKEQFKEWFEKQLPCIKGSDSHESKYPFGKLKDKDSKPTDKYCWIKADPTFEGLKQIIFEPEDRVFIGAIPKSIEMKNEQPTKMLDSIKIQKVAGSILNEDWFNQELKLNPDLVAIIGNKGSGKSALAEVLGLLGNTPRYKSFSFLHDTRFRKLPENKARDFESSILWHDKSSKGPLSLDKNPQLGQQEKIKYIPQNYLEEICNEINIGEGSKFNDEIQDVIFSHVPIPDRVEYSSLKELLKYRSEETRKAIENFILELQELNAKIIDSEERLSAQYSQGLESKLEEKKKELDAHDSPTVKPKEEKPPEENPEVIEKSKTISSQLDKKLEAIKKIEDEIQNEISKDKQLAIKYTTVDKILTRYQNVDRQLKKDLEETKADLINLGINQSDVFSYKLNLKILENKKLEIQNHRDDIDIKLNEKREGSLAHSKKAINIEIKELQSRLTEPQQKYQTYQRLLKEWGEKRKIIIDSKKEIEEQLEKLKAEPKVLEERIQKRNKKTTEIFEEKEKLKEYYVSYYSGVHKFLQEDPVAKGEDFKLTFNVSILEKGFEDDFFMLINQRVAGPFMGLKEGSTELNKLLSSTNFDSAKEIIKFANELLTRMKEYGGKKMNIADQLVGKKTLKELYDYIFSLQYLEPNYNLKWDKKDLSQLSPGEKGNLLLIFYLLVDRDNIPLVIDQPEANLDNNTVYKTLVPCIKDAKRRRQIIIVTHNPNLAVVCDAEQIIHAEIDKEHRNKVTYTSGSIENPAINKYIVDVLEGTQPAFDNRDSKYMRINY